MDENNISNGKKVLCLFLAGLIGGLTASIICMMFCCCCCGRTNIHYHTMTPPIMGHHPFMHKMHHKMPSEFFEEEFIIVPKPKDYDGSKDVFDRKRGN